MGQVKPCYRCGDEPRLPNTSWCRPCQRAYDNSRWSYKNERRLKNQRAMDDVKVAKGCARCGFDACPAALHFHHRDPSKKKFEISQRMLASIDNLLAEAEKCDVLCATCHAMEHCTKDWCDCD